MSLPDMKDGKTRILAISGSLRSNSSNTAILTVIGSMAPPGMTYAIYDGLGKLPHFSPELDGDDPPAPVKDLRLQLASADGILICTPEYAFGVPGVLKNALDWTVSSGELANKPVAVITASTSGEKAHQSLQWTLTALSARIADGGTLLIPFVRTKVSAGGVLSDPKTLESLKSILDALARAIGR